jgi:hypothetical protein
VQQSMPSVAGSGGVLRDSAVAVSST